MAAARLPTPSSSWHLSAGRFRELPRDGSPGYPPAGPLKPRILAELRARPLRYVELCKMLTSRPGSIANALSILARRRLVVRPSVQGGEWRLVTP